MNNEYNTLLALLDNHIDSGEATDADAVLMLFMEYVESLGIEMYPAQEEAILELLAHKHVILNTPTGSGKSLVALACHFQAIAEDRVSYYTAPTKALVNEKFFSLCETLGAENVGLITGDGSVNQNAPVICCTAEILSNKSLREDDIDIDYVIMDEFHYYGDAERGVAWQIPLITMRDSVFLLMSATLGDTTDIRQRLADFTDREVSVVTHGERPVPLSFDYRETNLHETIETLVEDNKAPVYLVNFTQRDCAEQAQNLMSINVSSKDVKKQIAKELEGTKFSSPYGKEFSRFLRHGIGVHHAGLLPKYRRVVERLAQKGLIKVVSGTDTLGVGVNIPIRTVVLRQLYKFDGQKMGIVTAREFHQIAGRAGRKGFDDEGYVVVQAPEWVIENKKREAKIAGNPHLKKKLKKVSPPNKSVPYNQQTMEELIARPPEALTPRFEVTHGMLINLLQSAGGSNKESSDGTDAGSAASTSDGYRRLIELIRRSHGSSKDKSRRRKRAAQLLRSLRAADIIHFESISDAQGKQMVVNENLQKDFSLNYNLSLYLVQTAETLEESPDSALTMLTLVESIQENPRAVLYRQEDLVKGEMIAKWKADGLSYDERMEKLEHITYPKPMADYVYETFNAFAKDHPWLEDDNIKPKGVAREMYEQCFDFNNYVIHLGLARSEGVLLRYLGSVYKTAVQSVPERLWTEEFEDILAYFHAIIRQVDATLIEEWELLMHGPQESDTAPDTQVQPKRTSIADNPRAFKARVRVEMHELLRALAHKKWDDAAEKVYKSETFNWSANDIEQMMAPFYEDRKKIDLSPLARMAHNTTIREDAHRKWTIYQKIIDTNLAEEHEVHGEHEEDGETRENEQHGDWGIQCQINLESPRDETLPLIELVTVEG